MGKLRENNYKGEMGQWNRGICVSTIGKPVWNRTHNTQKRLKDWITSVLKVYNTKTPWKKLKDIQNLEKKMFIKYILYRIYTHNIFLKSNNKPTK